MNPILKQSGEAVLLGNEAVVRGALEAGVQFVTTYPGTPASEVGDTFSAIQSSEDKIGNLYFEYSTNEMAALEAGIGASYSGLKTLVAMKHFGANVCSDALMPFCYTGSKGPTVIIVADDPSCHSSGQSEENTRAFANLAHIPILEPSDPQEAKDFVKKGFEISEEFNLPVMIRTTTRIAHQRQPVMLESFNIPPPQAHFEKDFKQLVTMPPRVLEMKEELLCKIERLRKISEQSPLNKIRNKKQETRNSQIGILTSGVSYLYVKEALEKLGVEIPVLKLGFFYPKPVNKIKEFIKNLGQLVVVEELEPYLENKATQLAKEVNPQLEIIGKDKFTKAKKKLDHNLPSQAEEYRPEYVTSVMAKVCGKDYTCKSRQPSKKIKHIPRFCDQCPYWRLLALIRKAVKEIQKKENVEIVFGGDIGCYMMAGLAHTQMQDYLLNMGASVGVAHGIEKALSRAQNTNQKVIAFIGDSTFFHAGIPNLINSVYNQSNPLIIVFDNRITAMTGHQPNPGMEKTGMGEKAPHIEIEKIAQACGVKHTKTIDQIENPQQITNTVKKFLKNNDGPSVIVAKHICWLWEKRTKRLS